jgi:fumarylacetoacetase
MTPPDHTLAPRLRSWVESANDPTTDFPIQNLPFGVFKRGGTSESPRVGVAIGDQILDIVAAAKEGLLRGAVAPAAELCREPSLNGVMALGDAGVRVLRHALSDRLRSDSPAFLRDRTIADRILVSMRDAELVVPVQVGDYTDFYASIHHATNVGGLFRPTNPLLPNYKWVPIGYHGRASSIVVSGTPVRRPIGQTHDDAERPPTFTPSQRLDYELEVGAFIGAGNELGTPIPIAEAEHHIFGLCLINDWSARDIQTWEYQPLGPFLSKNFITTMSPWVVTMDALAPYRAPAYKRPDGDPRPLPYLSLSEDEAAGGFAVTLEVLMTTAAMRAGNIEPFRISVGAFSDMYGTMAQLVAHHSSNGCNLRPGDLLGSGTVSGPTVESRGCLLERTMRGSDPLQMPTGERRAFLEDGDEVTMRGYCERAGHPRIGFGECRGRVVPPHDV